MSDRRAQLTSILGLDEFGDGVLSLVKTQLTVLPEPLQHSTCVAPRPSQGKNVAPEILETRERLASLDNVDQIESEPEWTVARRGDRVSVHHFVVGEHSSMQQVAGLASAIDEENPLDRVTGICFQENLDDHVDDLRQENFPSWSRLFICSSTNRNGEEVETEAVQSTIAVLVITSLLHDLPGSNSSSTKFSTFGGAGLYGLTGPALRKLATHLARDLIAHHRSRVTDDQELPQQLSAFVDDHDPRELGRRLFLDTDLQPQVSAENTPLTTEPIPAMPEWNDNRLSVSMSEGRLGLELTGPGEEGEWASQIQNYARSFDMTIGYQWRRQLEEGAAHLAEDIRNSFVDHVRSFLTEFPHSPDRVARTLEQIEDKLEESYRPADRQAISDLDSTLSELEEAVAERPDRLALSLRLAVWVVPALIAGSIALNGLYEGTRGIVFPVLFLVLGAALPIGWALWRIQRARDEMKEARDEALETTVRRQEALVAENTVEYLNGTVLNALQGAVSESQTELDEYEDTLKQAHKNLSASAEESLDAPLTFEPILSEPEEYDRALELIVDDLTDWLQEAMNDEVLSVDEDADALPEKTVDWCEQRLQNHLQGHSAAPLKTLWEIRKSERAEEDNLTDALDSLWHFSTPLAESRYAPDPSSESQIVLLPERFDTSKLGGDATDFSKEVIQELQTAPLLICLRMGRFERPNSRA